MDADTFKAEFLTGLNHQQAGQYDAAIAVWNRLLEARPDSAEALSQRGLSQFWAGDQEAGLADIHRALDMATDKAPIHYHLASLLLERADQTRAVDHLLAAGRGAEDNGLLLVMVVDDLIRLDRADAALALAETAATSHPGDARTQAALAKALLAQARIEAAATAAAGAYERLPFDPFVLEAYAAAMMLADRQKETQAALSTIERMPSEMLERAFIVIARLLEANRDYHKALKFYQALVQGGSDTLSVMVDFARLALPQGELEAARATLDRVLKRTPDLATALMLMGEYHLRTGGPAKGVPLLRQALASNGALVDCYRLMQEFAPGSLTDGDREALRALATDATLPTATRDKAGGLLG
ncbi:tetratricopeptide repeat protein [Rhodothalassium salexigens DSM 2132]|uniref:Tetratricopeptide repeat protein n=1 Tax=Rhodothalassium salexigens DSM 2132 TaxID=1188247 RepID=A0A4R2PR07_RHOSA|nr:tetratricopeptide repeat protein [Rhodothalassium salexigens]MBB4210107.1 tetratricopeptide (TPR) repeat protein [Rhodothalassium salexigens DSM 2132]MBK1638431.1 hypothetical protein [Rhodothalassium salexigens DSM 2132]TCP38272.1 tetratricopeptide repeat protein [Rhodothalassium salexigens DSM 2132]